MPLIIALRETDSIAERSLDARTIWAGPFQAMRRAGRRLLLAIESRWHRVAAYWSRIALTDQQDLCGLAGCVAVTSCGARTADPQQSCVVAVPILDRGEAPRGRRVTW